MKKTFVTFTLVLSLLVAFSGMAQDARSSNSNTKKETSGSNESAKAQATKADIKNGAATTANKASQPAANDRMAAARAAKAAKKTAAETSTTGTSVTTTQTTRKTEKVTDNSGLKDDRVSNRSAKMDKMGGDNKMAKASKPAMKEEKATPADYKAPVDRSMKGPNGEQVMTGPRGGKFYINKNGNKTYMGSQRD